jgi:hypothetical protein
VKAAAKTRWHTKCGRLNCGPAERVGGAGAAGRLLTREGDAAGRRRALFTEDNLAEV